MTLTTSGAVNRHKKIAQSMLGAHFSVAGGLEKAVITAKKYHCRALQIFSKNARTWKEKQLNDIEINAFRKACTDFKIKYILSHASYLINVASPDQGILKRSIEALKSEIIRSSELGVDYVVLHPGAFTASTEKKGMETIAKSINKIYNQIWDHYGSSAPRLLLETMAGQGTQIGGRFNQLSKLLQRIDIPEKTGGDQPMD